LPPGYGNSRTAASAWRGFPELKAGRTGTIFFRMPEPEKDPRPGPPDRKDPKTPEPIRKDPEPREPGRRDPDRPQPAGDPSPPPDGDPPPQA
jgi:hypothetical protein